MCVETCVGFSNWIFVYSRNGVNVLRYMCDRGRRFGFRVHFHIIYIIETHTLFVRMGDTTLSSFVFVSYSTAGIEWNCVSVAALHADYRLSQMAAASDVDQRPMYTAQLHNVFASVNG